MPPEEDHVDEFEEPDPAIAAVVVGEFVKEQRLAGIAAEAADRARPERGSWPSGRLPEHRGDDAVDHQDPRRPRAAEPVEDFLHVVIEAGRRIAGPPQPPRERRETEHLDGQQDRGSDKPDEDECPGDKRPDDRRGAGAGGFAGITGAIEAGSTMTAAAPELTGSTATGLQAAAPLPSRWKVKRSGKRARTEAEPPCRCRPGRPGESADGVAAARFGRRAGSEISTGNSGGVTSLMRSRTHSPCRTAGWRQTCPTRKTIGARTATVSEFAMAHSTIRIM